MSATGNNISKLVPPIVVRRAAIDDARLIAAVRVESWRITYRGIVPDAYLDSMDLVDAVDLWQRVLEAPPGITTAVFVAEMDGKVVGFAAGHALAEPKFGIDAELTAVYLLPEAQRRGIGTRLVRLLAQTLHDAGANGMLAWVLAKNKVAREFFEELGGELLHEQDFTWDDLDLKEAGYGWRDLPALARG